MKSGNCIHHINGALCAVLLCAGFTDYAFGATNVVHVYPDEFQHKIGDCFAGANVVYSWETDDAWENNGIVSNLSAMDVSFIRYPGGEVTDFFHWQDPNGQGWSDTWDPNWDPANAAPATNWMSLAEYMDHIDACGGQPLLGINIDSGHVYSNRLQDAVDEAVAFVEYARTNGYAVEYWFIGNESYHSSGRSPSGSGEPMMTVTEYADYVNLYANAIRAVDPEIKIIANWNNAWSAQYETLLNIAGTNIDIIDLHCYWNWGEACWTNWIDELPMQHGDRSYAEKQQQFRQNLDALGYSHIQVGLFEYNLGGFKENAWPTPYQTALINSEIMLQNIQGGLDMGCFWPLNAQEGTSETAEKTLLDPNSSQDPQPAYYALQFFSPIVGHYCVQSSDNYNRTFTSAALSPTKDVLTVYILRKAQWSTAVELNTHGFGAEDILVETFQGYNGDETSNYAEIITPSYTNLANGNIAFSVPAWSLTRVTLMKSTYQIETGTETASCANWSDWKSASFTNSFDLPPVIICSPLTCNDTDPALIRVRNITTNGFEFRISEWDYQDDNHGTETFHWIAVPEGVHLIDGTVWEAGFVASDHNWWKAHRFKHKFSSTPYVFYQTYQDGNSTVSPRVRNRTSDRFEIRLDEEEANGWHVYENIGYLAVPWTGSANLNGRTYKAISTGACVTDAWRTKSFNGTMTSPQFIACMQDGETDTDPFGLRYRNLTTDSVQLKVDEEASQDAELSHSTGENIAILVIGN